MKKSDVSENKPIRKREARNNIDSPKWQKHTWLLAFFVALITFIVYIPALKNGFVNWDDNIYVYENQNIRSLDFNFVKWNLSAVVASLWHPLTMFSLALDNAIWGLNSAGFHLTSIIFHTLNTFLVFILITQLKRHGNSKELSANDLIVGFTTALLFGIHPLHVESVAWVSERKDTLSTFFYLSSILAYHKYLTANRALFYGTSIIFFAMALISKPMAVSLPLVLLILDFYPFKRWKTGKLKRLFVEKLPFLALSISASLITIWAHSTGGSIATLESAPLMSRIFVAARAIIFYLIKMIMPFNLAPYYPYPTKVRFMEMDYAGSLVLLLFITLLCIWSLKREKLFSAIWLYYLVTLIPVIGIVQVGSQAAADRYTYLPSLGPFLLAGLGVSAIFATYSSRCWIAIPPLILLACITTNKTITQIAVWKDSVTLWSHEIKLFPLTAELAYNSRGIAYKDLGDDHKAIRDFNTAIKINPEYADAYYNRGNVYVDSGDTLQAIRDYSSAIKLNSRHLKAYYNRGNAFKDLGNHQAAIKDYTTAIEIDPEFVDAYYNRGNTYYDLRNVQDAISDYNTVIALNPNHAGAYINRGNVYNIIGKVHQAITDYGKAIELNPMDANSYLNRGLAYINLNEHQSALKDFDKVIELNPSNATAYKLRGNSYIILGQYQQAINDLSRAIELSPKDAEAYRYLGIAYSRIGKAKEAAVWDNKAATLGLKQ